MRPAFLVAHSGILVVLALLALIFTAAANYPGYSPSFNYLSDLGTGSGAIYFNAGVILSGIIGAFFGLWAYVKIFSKKKSKLGTLASATIIVSGTSLAGVGVFNSGSQIHNILAAIFFLSVAATMVLVAAEFRTKAFTLATAALLLVVLTFFILRTQVMEHAAVGAVMLWCMAANVVFVKKYESEISRIRDRLFDALDAR